MVQPYEGEIDDLFDFPEVPGLEEFGLVPPIPKDLDVSAYQAGDAGESPASDDSARSNAGAEAAQANASAAASAAEPRPNPPVPEGITDLDEDLFDFHELFSLEDDPFYNGTLAQDGTPLLDQSGAEDQAATDVFAETEDASGLDVAPLQEQSDPANAFATESESDAATASSSAEAQAQAAQGTLHVDAPGPSLMDHGIANPLGDSNLGQVPQLARDRGPRLLLPEDIPYSTSGETSRLIWALVACFLLINTGIFVLAHQASTNVNATISEATGLIAEALQQRNATAGETLGSAPATISSQVTHSMQPIQPAAEGGVETGAKTPEPWVDPRNYENTHAFAVGRAKALLTDGRFEDARRLLNNVLANQARIPLSNELREEIDYLIPMSYYQQGRATAPEVKR